jgi:hypothetical protein
VQTESPSHQPLLFEGEGHSKVIVDDIENSAEMTSICNDGDFTDSILHASNSTHPVIHDRSKVTPDLMKTNDLDLSGVRKCDICDKACVMCVLHRAQLQLQTAVEEMENPKSSRQFCSCDDHKHVHALDCNKS